MAYSCYARRVPRCGGLLSLITPVANMTQWIGCACFRAYQRKTLVLKNRMPAAVGHTAVPDNFHSTLMSISAVWKIQHDPPVSHTATNVLKEKSISCHIEKDGGFFAARRAKTKKTTLLCDVTASWLTPPVKNARTCKPTAKNIRQQKLEP